MDLIVEAMLDVFEPPTDLLEPRVVVDLVDLSDLRLCWEGDGFEFYFQ